MPALGEYEQWLADLVLRIGIACAGETLTYGEILAWCELTDMELTPWEAETMREMSGAFLSSMRASEKDDAPPPLMTEAGRERLAREYAERRKAALGDRFKG